MRKFSVVIPESVVSYKEVADQVSIVLSQVFGGYNQYEGNGGWVDDNGELMKEAHVRVEAWSDFSELGHEDLNKVYEVMQLVLDNQDCILIEYDGRGELVNNDAELGHKIFVSMVK